MKHKRKARKVYSIIVDGQTEKWYFDLLKKYEKNKISKIDIKPELPRKKKLKDLYSLAKENVKDYDKVFWLVDLDAVLHNNQIQEFGKYCNEVDKEESNLEILVNSPCLEYWFLLHTKDTSKFFPACRNAEKELKKSALFKDYEKTEKYFKNSANNVYAKLKPFQQAARERAKKLGDFNIDDFKNAKAEVYKIFKELEI